MNRINTRRASVALVAAVAVNLVSAVHAEPPNIINSFPLHGIEPSQARGVYYRVERPHRVIYVISHERPGENYIYKFISEGSLVSSFLLRGASVVGDADRAPDEYTSSCFSVVDVGTNDVKIYTVEGSLVGTLFPAPPETVAVGIGGHSRNYIYLGARDGVILVYYQGGAFITSFATAIEIADLVGSGAYGYEWGDHVLSGPRYTSNTVIVKVDTTANFDSIEKSFNIILT